MKVNQKKAGVLLTYLAQGIHIVSGLLYTPIMLRLLGQSEYGLYQLGCFCCIVFKRVKSWI